MLYPMNVELGGRPCLVLGGGRVARRKIDSLLKAGGEVTVVSPELSPEVAAYAESGKIRWERSIYRPGTLARLRPFLAICAADDREANELAVKEAKKLGILVNAPGKPDLGDFNVPAGFSRGKLLVTLSTGGQSPGFSRALRKKLAPVIHSGYGDFLDKLGVLRAEAKQTIPNGRTREKMWRWLWDGEQGEKIMALVAADKVTEAEVAIRDAIISFGTEPQDGPGVRKGEVCPWPGDRQTRA